MEFPDIRDEHPAFILSDPGENGKVLMIHATSSFFDCNSNNIYKGVDCEIFSKPSILKFEKAREADKKNLLIYLNKRKVNYYYLKVFMVVIN